jgi:hypothetical protein
MNTRLYLQIGKIDYQIRDIWQTDRAFREVQDEIKGKVLGLIAV